MGVLKTQIITLIKTDLQIHDFLCERYTAAQTPWGRWRLNLRVRCKRLLWNWLVSGSLFIKRLFDIVASGAAILALSPLLLAIAILIKLKDRGPIIFTQIRVGQFGRKFKMFKFRSMCLDAENRLQALLAKNVHAEGVTFKLADDPRITRLGKVLRKYSLDELPQLFNVFRGDMSMVGPRPPMPREVALYQSADRRRLAVKPGITCIWQVSGRSQIDFSGQVRLDVAYIESQSFWQDVKILARTVPAVITGRGAG